MDPTLCRWGPFWTPITPKVGSLFHADQQASVSMQNVANAGWSGSKAGPKQGPGVFGTMSRAGLTVKAGALEGLGPNFAVGCRYRLTEIHLIL